MNGEDREESPSRDEARVPGPAQFSNPNCSSVDRQKSAGAASTPTTSDQTIFDYGNYQTRCNRCGTKTTQTNALCDACADTADECEYIWLPARPVVFAISGSRPESSRALAKGAADHTSDRFGEGLEREQIRLVEDIRDPPLSTFKPGWKGLEDTVESQSESGNTLIESIHRNQRWDDDISAIEMEALRLDSGTSIRPHVFDRWGDAVSNRDEFTKLVSSQHCYLCPGIAFRRVLDITEEETRGFICNTCGEKTTHIADGRIQDPRDMLKGQRVWVCRWCESPRTV